MNENINNPQEQTIIAPVNTEEVTTQDVTSEEQTTDNPQETNEESQEQKNDAPKADAPKIKTTEDKTSKYHGFFIAPMNHLDKITNALIEMAKTDKELADAIALGKKTFEGCDRYIRNNMKDLAREMGKKEIVFEPESIHQIARYYMVTTDNLDVQNVAKAISKPKTEKKPKETKPKAESKPKTKVVPLTPQMGDMFADFFDDENNK